MPEEGEAEYWRVTEPSTVTAEARHKNVLPLVIISTDQEAVDEGGEAIFTVRRSGGFDSELGIRVDFNEPYHPGRGFGGNPSQEYRNVTFNVGEREKQLTVTAAAAAISESYDILQGFIVHTLNPDTTYRIKAYSPGTIWITDDDWMRVSMTADRTAVVEGDELTFTLTRLNNLQNHAIVGISIEDPGNFLRGNHWENTPALPSSIEFLAGEDTASFTLATRDDWRDIPDNAITVGILPEPAAYEVTSGALIEVTVADNDVAPQLSLAYGRAEVEEGKKLKLTLQRIGDDRNPVDFAFDSGPRDSQSHTLYQMAPGKSEITFLYPTVDDDYNGPDIHHESTLHTYGVPPDVQAEYWTIAGPATSTATVRDNDLPTVSLENFNTFVWEGHTFYIPISRTGYTEPTLEIETLITVDGAVVNPANLAGEKTFILGSPYQYKNFHYTTVRVPGDSVDGTVTIEILESPDYLITDRFTPRLRHTEKP